jgi:uncharacterized membrane protein YfcA
MTDKTLNIFLLLLFGVGGIVVSVLAWVQPASISERIFTTLVGLAGLSWALSRLLPANSKAGIDTVRVPAEVKAKNEPG